MRHEYRCDECGELMSLVPWQGSCSEGNGMLCNGCGRKVKVEFSKMALYADPTKVMAVYL